MRACRRFVQIVNEIKPAVVHLHTPAAAIPSRMIPRALIPDETRVVYTVHGFAHVWDGSSWRDRALEWTERALAPRTDLMLFQSREDFTETRARGYRTTLRYLGNGVEDAWFTIQPRAVPSTPLELLFVGRLVREKGVLDLLEALSLVSGANLTIVGTELPTERDGVESAARSRAEEPDLIGRVRFLGAVPKDDMPAVVANCDAMVLPSYREGVPRSLIEGFAAGRPAVATDVRGCRELVQDGVTGFLVPPRNPDLLAAALRRLVDLSPDQYRAMSAAAHALASDQYRESTVLDRLLNAYAEIGVPTAAVSFSGLRGSSRRSRFCSSRGRSDARGRTQPRLRRSRGSGQHNGPNSAAKTAKRARSCQRSESEPALEQDGRGSRAAECQARRSFRSRSRRTIGRDIDGHWR